MGDLFDEFAPMGDLLMWHLAPVLEVRPSPDFHIVQVLERRGSNQQFSILHVPVIQPCASYRLDMKHRYKIRMGRH